MHIVIDGFLISGESVEIHWEFIDKIGFVKIFITTIRCGCVVMFWHLSVYFPRKTYREVITDRKFRNKAIRYIYWVGRVNMIY